MAWLARRLRCALLGHLWQLEIRPTRMWLRCVTCGAETHGWTVPEASS